MGDFALAVLRFTSAVARLVESTVLHCCNQSKRSSSVTGSKHEDGTQSDSENGLGLRFGSKRHAALEERLRAAGVGRVRTEGLSGASRTAFMIEFYDEDNPRKRRSYSFSQTAPLLGGVAGEGLCPTPPSRPKGTDGSKGMSSLAAVAPTAARLLLKQRSEEQNVAQSSAGTGQTTDEAQKQDDDQSDKGTYTIELDKHNPEEEEARRMIDKVKRTAKFWLIPIPGLANMKT